MRVGARSRTVGGGEGGIRTHEAGLPAYPLSRRALSTTQTPLRFEWLCSQPNKRLWSRQDGVTAAPQKTTEEARRNPPRALQGLPPHDDSAWDW